MQKEALYQEIKKQFVPYTIIDVGYWYQLSFPTLPSGRVDYAAAIKPKTKVRAGGTAPTMLTDLRDIGRFVADSEALYSYEGTREINTLIVGRAVTGLSAFV